MPVVIKPHTNTINYPIAQEDFNLAQTLDCGQCFRWNSQTDGSYLGVVGRHLLQIWQLPDHLVFCGEDADFLEHTLPRYLGLDEDYPSIRVLLSRDPVLQKAISYAPGIRILRQDSWEALCSFIISQNNNIKRIKGIIERLCHLLGQPIGDSGFFSFPTPEKLAGVTAEQLAPLRCGFRARYLIDAAQKVCSGQVRLDAIPSMPLEEARRELMQICGVGPKVADCVLLFGFHRLECCPMDVWMKRVFAVLYPNGLPDCARDFVGIAQQYLFHYARTCPQAFDPEEVSA